MNFQVERWQCPRCRGWIEGDGDRALFEAERAHIRDHEIVATQRALHAANELKNSLEPAPAAKCIRPRPKKACGRKFSDEAFLKACGITPEVSLNEETR